jgi:hypothetical protein
MLALVLGTLLAVGALCYVLYPLFADVVAVRPSAPRLAQASEGGEDEAVAALREIEFDRVTGKLSDGDYAELKARYTGRALAAMRSSADPDDAVEQAVQAYRARLRSCVACGPRPEPDAEYCSTCGSFLPGACRSCGVAVTEAGAAFCTSCGRALAA